MSKIQPCKKGLFGTYKYWFLHTVVKAGILLKNYFKSGHQDFAGQDFAGQDFAGQDFAGQDFTGQDFAGQDFAGQDFEGQDFAGQDFAGQDFAGQDLNITWTPCIVYVIPRIPEYIHYMGIFHYFPALRTPPSVLLSPCTPIRINKA